MAKWKRRKSRHVPAGLNQYFAANGNMICRPAAVEPEVVDPFAYDDPDAIRQALCALDCREVDDVTNCHSVMTICHTDERGTPVQVDAGESGGKAQ